MEGGGGDGGGGGAGMTLSKMVSNEPLRCCEHFAFFRQSISQKEALYSIKSGLGLSLLGACWVIVGTFIFNYIYVTHVIVGEKNPESMNPHNIVSFLEPK